MGDSREHVVYDAAHLLRLLQQHRLPWLLQAVGSEHKGLQQGAPLPGEVSVGAFQEAPGFGGRAKGEETD